jgi:hypothetical protein
MIGTDPANLRHQCLNAPVEIKLRGHPRPTPRTLKPPHRRGFQHCFSRWS